MSVIYKNGTYYGAGGGGEGADTEIIADDFDPTESYAVGAYVVYEGDLYKCTTAHTGEWNASDFDATQVMDEVPQVMPSADMSEVVTPLPGVMSRRFKYSTEEQVIGEWIDGKPVYQKSYVLGSAVALTTSSYTRVFTSPENVDKQISVIISNPLAYNVTVYPKADDIGMFAALYSANTLPANSVITIQYTKTTD